ncbi:MAG: hypothetical protein OHK0022_31730 [Roseiflexaceae bacterium]
MAPLAFGDWVKRQRKTLGMTQAGLAERVCCARVTVMKIEAEERRPSVEMAERLAAALEIPPAEHEQFLSAARAVQTGAGEVQRQPSAPASVPIWRRLSAPVGRGREIAAVCQGLRDQSCRLLTLIGPPGVGKSRLALAVAAALDSERVVVYVSLAALSAPEQIAPLVARHLGIALAPGQSPSEGLLAGLPGRRLLLVLDTFEHLLDGRALVAAMLACAPQLCVLAASRVALGLPGERRFVLEPLSLPPADELSAAELLRQSAAAGLFVERAQASAHGFALTDENAPAIAAICRRLDGLPLAIELVAGWAHVLTPRLMLERIHSLSGLEALVQVQAGRHRTIWSAIDWSFRLLAEDAQTLLMRLATCPNGCPLPLAEQLAAPHSPAQALGMIAALSDASLLHPVEQPDGGVLYTMLETVRDYALARLAEHSAAASYRRLSDYYLALTDGLVPGIATGPLQAQLDREQDNLRAALTHGK